MDFKLGKKKKKRLDIYKNPGILISEIEGVPIDRIHVPIDPIHVEIKRDGFQPKEELPEDYIPKAFSVNSQEIITQE